MPEPNTNARRAQQRLARQLAEIGFALPGTLTERYMRCGKAHCRCKADPPALHGPYLQWTRKVDGRTVTRLLSADQRDRYGDWFDNDRKLKDLVAQLETLSINTISEAEGWDPRVAKTLAHRLSTPGMSPEPPADDAPAPPGLEETERVFEALSHEVRRHIVQLLSHLGGELPSGYLAKRFAHSWPTTTRHLHVLEAAGLVSVQREGRNSVYRLERHRLQQVVGAWLALLDPPTPEQTWRSSGPRTITKGPNDE
jgi:DNA-binding transcriptional ArsR family regulator